MDPTLQQTDWLAELFRVGAVVLPTHRVGWERSRIDDQQREYILDREACVEALKRVQSMNWTSIHCGDKALAEAIRENAIHALMVMRDAMARNELRML